MQLLIVCLTVIALGNAQILGYKNIINKQGFIQIYDLYNNKDIKIYQPKFRERIQIVLTQDSGLTKAYITDNVPSVIIPPAVQFKTISEILKRYEGVVDVDRYQRILGQIEYLVIDGKIDPLFLKALEYVVEPAENSLIIGENIQEILSSDNRQNVKDQENLRKNLAIKRALHNFLQRVPYLKDVCDYDAASKQDVLSSGKEELKKQQLNADIWKLQYAPVCKVLAQQIEETILNNNDAMNTHVFASQSSQFSTWSHILNEQAERQKEFLDTLWQHASYESNKAFPKDIGTNFNNMNA